MQARVFSPSLLMMSVFLALSISQPALALDNNSYLSGIKTDDRQHNKVNSKYGSVALGNDNTLKAVKSTLKGFAHRTASRMPDLAWLFR